LAVTEGSLRGDPLLFVKMKSRRADEHFQSLEAELGKWADKPYTVIKEAKFKSSLYIVRVDISPTPEAIPMLLGDFICCLRSALDQLAWRLAHLAPVRKFTEREERRIQFPISKVRDANYKFQRSLFPSTVAKCIDTFQPHLRGNAFRDDPLWQLNELWTMDKHRTIPISPYSLNIGFALDRWERFVTPASSFHHYFEVAFPLGWALTGQVDLEPHISVEILFGDDSFEISRTRLSEINNFVRNDVIPRFTGFFP
jgi:hypothetical protein